jgi:hypothetical protein
MQTESHFWCALTDYKKCFIGMLTSMSNKQELINKLNRETSKISWLELQKFYASGAVVAVSDQADLINVAIAFSRDDKADVAAWLSDRTIYKVDDELAQEWWECEQQVWVVVVAPWVLVQKIKVE